MTDLGIVRHKQHRTNIKILLSVAYIANVFCLFFKILTLLMTGEISDSNWAYSCLYKKQLQKKKLKGL